MTDRCENCDKPVVFGHPHREERSSTNNGSVSAWTAWTCTPANWRERAIAAEAKAAVIGGDWCKENRAAGRNPCGACAICCAELRAELDALKAKRKKKEPKFEPIPDYGDHMTWEDFVSAVKTGGFIDYDGHGNLATATECSDKNIVPSQITRPSGFNKPSWCSHVVWYNR